MNCKKIGSVFVRAILRHHSWIARVRRLCVARPFRAAGVAQGQAAAETSGILSLASVRAPRPLFGLEGSSEINAYLAAVVDYVRDHQHDPGQFAEDRLFCPDTPLTVPLMRRLLRERIAFLSRLGQDTEDVKRRSGIVIVLLQALRESIPAAEGPSDAFTQARISQSRMRAAPPRGVRMATSFRPRGRPAAREVVDAPVDEDMGVGVDNVAVGACHVCKAEHVQVIAPPCADGPVVEFAGRDHDGAHRIGIGGCAARRARRSMRPSGAESARIPMKVMRPFASASEKVCGAHATTLPRGAGPMRRAQHKPPTIDRKAGPLPARSRDQDPPAQGIEVRQKRRTLIPEANRVLDVDDRHRSRRAAASMKKRSRLPAKIVTTQARALPEA